MGLEFIIQGIAETSRCRLRLETNASTSTVSDWSCNAGKRIDQARRTVAPTSDTFPDFLATSDRHLSVSVLPHSPLRCSTPRGTTTCVCMLSTVSHPALRSKPLNQQSSTCGRLDQRSTRGHAALDVLRLTAKHHASYGVQLERQLAPQCMINFAGHIGGSA